MLKMASQRARVDVQTKFHLRIIGFMTLIIYSARSIKTQTKDHGSYTLDPSLIRTRPSQLHIVEDFMFLHSGFKDLSRRPHHLPCSLSLFFVIRYPLNLESENLSSVSGTMHQSSTLFFREYAFNFKFQSSNHV
jgi:hypothetical protein